MAANHNALQPLTINDNSEGDEEDDEDKKDEEASDIEEEVIPDPLSPTSKKVQNLGVKGQYERKARNVMLKINKAAQVISANCAGELVVNDHAVPDSKRISLSKRVF